jgi:hypothetical protein
MCAKPDSSTSNGKTVGEGLGQDRASSGVQVWHSVEFAATSGLACSLSSLCITSFELCLSPL